MTIKFFVINKIYDVYINSWAQGFDVKSVSLNQATACNIVNKFACSSFSLLNFSQSIFFLFFHKMDNKDLTYRSIGG